MKHIVKFILIFLCLVFSTQSLSTGEAPQEKKAKSTSKSKLRQLQIDDDFTDLSWLNTEEKVKQWQELTSDLNNDAKETAKRGTIIAMGIVLEKHGMADSRTLAEKFFESLDGPDIDTSAFPKDFLKLFVPHTTMPEPLEGWSAFKNKQRKKIREETETEVLKNPMRLLRVETCERLSALEDANDDNELGPVQLELPEGRKVNLSTSGLVLGACARLAKEPLSKFFEAIYEEIHSSHK